MSVQIIFKEESDRAREVLDYLRDFERQTGHKLETVNPDTPEGAQLCRVYDIVEYPTVIATTSDGQIRNLWRGSPLPTISEVSYYV
ncbi:MAG: hypothetical protein WC306_03105 [Candidatus Paceibacterota bacterium]|jgi:hypothetical protein